MKNNWPLLAGLRGFLAVIVMSWHLQATHAAEPLWCQFLKLFSNYGAVIGFFLISGYSIAHSYAVEPQGFYERRIERIYPVFFIGFLISLVPFAVQAYYPNVATLEPPTSMWSLFLNAFPVQTLLVKPLTTNAVTWTLGIECAFYALAPWFARWSRKTIWYLVAGSAVINALSGFLDVGVHWSSANPIVAASMLWAWLLGWLIYHERNNSVMRTLAIGLPVIIYGLYLENTEPFAMLTIGGTAALLLFQDEIRLSARIISVFKYAGELSYPLYTVHYAVFTFIGMIWVHGIRPELSVVAVFVVTLIVYHAFDAPLRSRAHARHQRRKNAAVPMVDQTATSSTV